jgi:hypothetical protein
MADAKDSKELYNDVFKDLYRIMLRSYGSMEWRQVLESQH